VSSSILLYPFGYTSVTSTFLLGRLIIPSNDEDSFLTFYMLVFIVKSQDETPHDDLAVKLSNEILSNPGSFNVRTLVRVLCSLRMSSSDENVLKDLKILCRRMLKVCHCLFLALFSKS